MSGPGSCGIQNQTNANRRCRHIRGTVLTCRLLAYLCTMQLPESTFEEFVACFAEVELPVILTEQSITTFQKRTTPLSQQMVDRFIKSLEEPDDEFVEFVPCIRIPETHDFVALVYWKGELMRYRYVLVTYDLKGRYLASAVIAGTQSDGSAILRSVATIEEDWMIHIVEGDQQVDMQLYQPRQSRAYTMELLATGEIVLPEPGMK